MRITRVRGSERGAVLMHVAIGIARPDRASDLRRRLRRDVGRRAARRRTPPMPARWPAPSRWRSTRTAGPIGPPTGPARTAARQMALTNTVWGQSPDVVMATDVFFTGHARRTCARPMSTAIRRAFAWTSIATRRAATRCRRSSAQRAGSPTRRPSDGDRASRGGRRQRLHEAVGDSRQVARRLRRDGVRPTARQHVDAGRQLRDAHGQGSNETPLANPDVYTPPSAERPRHGLHRRRRSRSRSDAQGRQARKTRSRRACSIRFGCRATTAPARAATTTARTSRAVPDCRSRSATRSRARTAT